MIKTDPNHKHKYDANGKQLCCTLEEKINSKTDKQSGCCTVDYKSEHSDDDGHDHDHSGGNESTLKMFLPALISFTLLLIAIAFDNYFTQIWFTGWIRLIWYVVAYVPVGFPVLKEAFESIRKGEVFSEFLLMSIATIGAFAIREYP
ncbi:MAG: heavy metal translocating P-type ATPase, partial [Flavobacterium sp.]|nr:heavy metal translocating P-type ATPase [Flavobacterium sp.]